MPNNITLIQFSPRSNGNCNCIISYLKGYFKHTNVQTFTINNDTLIPCGNCDYECLKNGSVCPNLTGYLTHVMDSICNSVMTYFVIPNYCGFPCASYFAFNERSVGYFNSKKELLEKYLAANKRFIIVSNCEEENIKQAMQQQVCSEPDILYLKSQKYGKVSIDGDLLDSKEARDDLKAFLSHKTYPL